MSTNGKLDFSTLTKLSVGGYLTPAAANSFERLRVAGSRAGINITITSNADAYRIYAVQERIFTDRYRTVYTEYAPGKVDKRYWNGRAWFRRPGTAAAAVPGTSNHGWAIAIDIANVGGFNGTFYKWLASNAPAFGWSNDEGMPLGEPWHWKYSASGDGGGGTAPTPTPTPTPEEDDMTPEQVKKLDEIHWMLSTVRSQDLPPIRQQTDRLPKIHAGVDLLRAAVTNVTNGVKTILVRSE